MRLFMVGIVLFVHGVQAQPRALSNMSGRRATRAISILQVHIQELKYGREGPDYFAVDRAPYTGKQEIVEATLFGQEGIASVRFELIDGLGGRIATVPALRIGDGADADQYLLEVDVPRQPFRFRIQGEDAQGRPFTNIFSRLFVAVEGSAPPRTNSQWLECRASAAIAGIN